MARECFLCVTSMPCAIGPFVGGEELVGLCRWRGTVSEKQPSWIPVRGLRGSTKGNRRDTNTGPKFTQGKKVVVSQILVRQTGTRFLPGYGIGVGRDFTLYALHPGRLIFEKIRDKNGRKRTVVHVITEEDYMTMQQKRLQKIVDNAKTLGGILESIEKQQVSLEK